MIPQRACLGTLGVLLLAVSGLSCRRETPAQPAATPVPTPVPSRVLLFFPGDDTLLHRENREVAELPASMPARIRLLVDELLAGSQAGWAAPFPWPVTVELAFVDRDGNAFIDLAPLPPEGVDGSAAEVALLYSVTSTVVANCPGVFRVQLLFGGTEVASLGHLDLSKPVSPRPELVAP